MLTQLLSITFLASPANRRGGLRLQEFGLYLDGDLPDLKTIQNAFVATYGGKWVKDIFYPKSPLPEVELPVKRYPPNYYNC
jgi:hypothetical protein